MADFTVDANGLRWPDANKYPYREISRKELEICKRFFGQAECTKTARVDSYWLKHRIEEWAGEYVSNGACIQAAMELGFPIKPITSGYSFVAWLMGDRSRFQNPRPLSAFIGISKASMRSMKLAAAAH